MNKEITVQSKKLGKLRAYGVAYFGSALIQLDPRLTGKHHLETAIHEVLHLQNPEWSENMITKKAKQMCKVLWELDYRRVDNRTRQTSY